MDDERNTPGETHDDSGFDFNSSDDNHEFDYQGEDQKNDRNDDHSSNLNDGEWHSLEPIISRPEDMTPEQVRQLGDILERLQDGDTAGMSDEDEDTLFDYLIETQIKPQLSAALGEFDNDSEFAMTDDDGEFLIQGEMFIFGHTDGISADDVMAIRQRLSDGMTLEYALAEFTDLQIRLQRERNYRGMRIRYIELMATDHAVMTSAPTILRRCTTGLDWSETANSLFLPQAFLPEGACHSQCQRYAMIATKWTAERPDRC